MLLHHDSNLFRIGTVGFHVVLSMKVSEAFSENSVLENNLILLDGKTVLKKLEKTSAGADEQGP